MSVNIVNSSTGELSKIATRGQFVQYSVMPTASASIVNKIVQYTGTSTASYINGYFYKCTEVSTGVYGWTNISVQAGGGSGSDNVVSGYFNPLDDLFYEESTYTTPISGLSNVIYISLDTNLLYRYDNANLIFIRVDETSSDSDVINGYYNVSDGKFYEDSTYITEITGQVDKIYISVDTNIQYRWDGTDFITIGGSIPVASSSVLGGVKVGSDMQIDANGVLTTNLGLVVSNGKLCVLHDVTTP